MRIELHGRVQNVRLDPSADSSLPARRLGGRFLSEIIRLPAGSYIARVQIMFSEAAAGEAIQIGVKLLAAGTVLDRLELRARPENRQLLDDLYLRFVLPDDQTVEIYGDTEANCSSTLLRFLTLISADEGDDPESFAFAGYRRPSIQDLNCVIFGTTAICNASCFHCPTNKDYRANFPHGRMDQTLFDKIVEDLAAGGYRGWFLFGLFGEPLEDPLLEQRLRKIKQRLPGARISIATNCGVYDPQKHAGVVELADNIGVHVEAISPEIYDKLMHPLKANRVFPKIISLLSRDSNHKVHVTTPVHKGNLGEIAAIRRFFEAHGAGEPHFTQIGNRSWEKGPWSELSMLPVGGFCFPDDLKTFVVDWDGAVLACCLDFSRSAQLGDLKKQSVTEVLNSEAWTEMFEIHRTKNWCRKEACRNCRTDHYESVQRVVQPLLLTANERIRRFPASAFRVVPGAQPDTDGNTRIGNDVKDGIVVFGPYRQLALGRYRMSHLVEVTKVCDQAYLVIDIVKNFQDQIARREIVRPSVGPLELDVEFDSDGSVTEFRVAKFGVEFVHRGAIVQKI